MLGQIARATVANAPTAIAGVAIGFSNSQAGALVLPYEMTPFGMPGCWLLQSNEVFGLGITPATATTLDFALTLPNQFALLGAHVYLQAYAIAPGANPMQIVVSNGIDWLFGNT